MAGSENGNRQEISLYLFPLPISETGEVPYWLGEYSQQLLKDTRLIFAENERTARRFISSLKLGIRIEDIRIERLDKDSPESAIGEYISLLKDNKNALLMSESGCPAIADPGSLLVDACHLNEIRVIPVVGPSSILLALMASGLSGQQFAFHGYLPVDRTENSRKIRQLEIDSRKEKRTQIFIETPYRNSSIWDRLLENLSQETRLCFASDIGSPSEKIIQKRVSDWRIADKIIWEKTPTVFLFLA